MSKDTTPPGDVTQVDLTDVDLTDADLTQLDLTEAELAADELVVGYNRLRSRMREVATEDDLTPSEASVLSRLRNLGPTSASGLAAAEGVRPQSMSATVGALEAHGLVARHPDPDDGRRQLVALTTTGDDRAVGSRRARHAWLAEQLQRQCSERELRAIRTAMAALDRAIQL